MYNLSPLYLTCSLSPLLCSVVLKSLCSNANVWFHIPYTYYIGASTDIQSDLHKSLLIFFLYFKMSNIPQTYHRLVDFSIYTPSSALYSHTLMNIHHNFGLFSYCPPLSYSFSSLLFIFLTSILLIYILP